jgi:uncharacterized repeat protein (TIGR03803 family)
MRVPVRLLLSVLLLVRISSGHSATEEVLYSFRGGHSDGGWSEAGLALDARGNLYGTTPNFGPYGYGIVFQLSPSSGGWTETVIHGFCPDYPACSDGAYPIAGVVFDAAGNLYGTASYGGDPSGWGTVYQLKSFGSTWNLSALCTHDCLGDSYPAAEVILDRAGRIFGSVEGNPVFGGLGDVFALVPNDDGTWKHRVLYSFQFNTDGNHPSTALAIDRAHNLYGMTETGGAYNGGTVFEVSPAGRGAGQWTERTLVDFPLVLGGSRGGLTFEDAGNLFGTADDMIFELSPSGGNWTYTILYTFGQNEGGVLSRLTVDKDGNLYGTARIGGNPGCANAYGCGSVFKLTWTGSSWQKSTIYQFTGGADGGNPVGGVILDTLGNLYGVTNWGGLRNCNGLTCGVVYQITP